MRGLRLGLGLCRSAGATPVWTDDQINDWTVVLATVALGAEVDPETGLAATDFLETAATGVHVVQKLVPTTPGKNYRLRYLLKSKGRTFISINVFTDAGKFWVGQVGNPTPTFVLGMSNAVWTSLGNGWYSITVDFSMLAAVTVNATFSLRPCLDTSNSNYAGDITKGYHVGNVKLYEV